MLKPVIAATAILAIAGSSLVYAQQRFGDRDGYGQRGARFEHRHPVNPADVAAFTDARIAALKAGLELTPDQQKNWPAFEQALRDMAQLRMQRIEARQARMQQGGAQPGAAPQEGAAPQQGATPQPAETSKSPFDRLARRADAMSKTSAALKKVAETGAPLYQSLTDAQKERFKTLARVLRPHPRRFAFNEGNGGWRRGGRGMEGMDHGGRQHGRQDGDGNGGSQL
ncbi:MAG: Spy/CpxP family protein refolding chaperone [Xanthobacteraceae bacterium]